MWLDNLKELRKEKGNPSFKKIAEGTNLPERTIARIFAGDTNNPYVSTLDLIVKALGGSLDEIFSDTKVVVGTEKLATLQADLDIVKTESDILVAENTLLKDKVACLTAENDLLKRELDHKEEIINLHNFYNNALKIVSLKKGETDV
jgi:transcriptional regulator with XRE-family HTH domain